MSTKVHVNDTVQFTFFFVMRLNITIITSCDLVILTLYHNVFIIKAWKWNTVFWEFFYFLQDVIMRFLLRFDLFGFQV